MKNRMTLSGDEFNNKKASKKDKKGDEEPNTLS